MSLFVRSTIVIALGLIALVALAFLIKILFVAVILAAVVAGAILLYRALRRRLGGAAPIEAYRYRR
jgi:hypothetical protein